MTSSIIFFTLILLCITLLYRELFHISNFNTYNEKFNKNRISLNVKYFFHGCKKFQKSFIKLLEFSPSSARETHKYVFRLPDFV